MHAGERHRSSDLQVKVLPPPLVPEGGTSGSQQTVISTTGAGHDRLHRVGVGHPRPALQRQQPGAAAALQEPAACRHGQPVGGQAGGVPVLKGAAGGDHL